VTDRQLDDTRDLPRTADRIERVEERLVADVRARQAGTVRLRKHVVEEPEDVEVRLDHDEVDIERRPADRPLAPGEMPVSQTGDTTIVRIVEERLQVQRVPWVVEEIHVRRKRVTEARQVSDTVRKERWGIQPEGDVTLDQH
jgi:uncharacterized protein (TIGR02271 family)